MYQLTKATAHSSCQNNLITTAPAKPCYCLAACIVKPNSLQSSPQYLPRVHHDCSFTLTPHMCRLSSHNSHNNSDNNVNHKRPDRAVSKLHACIAPSVLLQSSHSAYQNVRHNLPYHLTCHACSPPDLNGSISVSAHHDPICGFRLHQLFLSCVYFSRLNSK